MAITPRKRVVQDRPGTTHVELFPIRTVSTLTGVNPITLRAWERRYGLVNPVRTTGGHRMYTREDIDTVHRILALIENGVAVGRARAALPVQDADPAQAPGKEELWREFRADMTNAISQFDENSLEDTYNELLSLYPIDQVTRVVLLPLLVELGERWSVRTGGIAEEHFFAVYLRNKLGTRFHHRNRGAAGAKLVTACLPGEHHEIGLLLFALGAHERGFQLVLLGADMPIAELAYAARRSHADAIVLSGSIVPEQELLERELSALVRGTEVPVFVGGLSSVHGRDAIVAAGANPLGSDIAAGLRRLSEILSHSAR